jgi:two-component system sensor histidine kinase PilS (NtrC family)
MSVHPPPPPLAIPGESSAAIPRQKAWNASSDPERTRRLLRILTGYRLALGLLLLLAATEHPPWLPLAAEAARQLQWEAAGYLLWGLLLLGLTLGLPQRLRIWEPLVGLVGDLLFIAALAQSHLGAAWLLTSNLFMIPLGVAASILSLEGSLTLVSLTSFFLLARGFDKWLAGAGTSPLLHAALFSILFFLITLILYSLSNRVRITERILVRQKLDLDNLSELNAYLVQRMPTGVVIFDRDDRIRFFNAAAAQLLSQPGSDPTPHVLNLLRFLRNQAQERPRALSPIVTPTGRSALPDLRPIGQQGYILTLEDLSQLDAKMHELKLQSMGRLTAAIAHEIRNPLSAIRHAAQLLHESPSLDPEDKRLNQITLDQVERLNQVIGNILTLSRPATRPAQPLELGSWLRGFMEEFASRHGITLPSDRIRAIRFQNPLEARMSPDLLHQIVWNLAENAFTHGAPPTHPDRAVVLFRLDRLRRGGTVLLGVLDRGPGIPENLLERIYDPFYSTAPQGTGLGLFIARELCTLNGLSLHHRSRKSGGSEFYILFPASQPTAHAS